MKIESELVKHKCVEIPFYYLYCGLDKCNSIQVILNSDKNYAIFEFNEEGIVKKFTVNEGVV